MSYPTYMDYVIYFAADVKKQSVRKEEMPANKKASGKSPEAISYSLAILGLVQYSA